MIETRHLRVLRAVSRTGSFSAAARELGCTQPAVSQQMKALELAAGTPLLVRAGRETRLTEAGEALTRHAAGILAGLTAAEEELAAIVGLRAGRVRMVSFPSGSSTIVPAAVARMRAEYPGTKVSLEEAEPPRSVEMLRSGDCEIALAFRYVDHLGADGGPDGVGHGAGPVRAGGPVREEWGDLVVRPLLTDRLVGLVPSGHRLAARGRPAWGGPVSNADASEAGASAPGVRGRETGAPDAVGPARGTPRRSPGRSTPPAPPAGAVRMADLAEEPWIAGCPRCRGHLVQVCEQEGFVPRIDFATDDYPAVAGLVGAGLGVAMLPELALRSVRPEGVTLIDVYPAVQREVVALTLPDLAQVPVVEGMLARLVEAARR